MNDLNKDPKCPETECLLNQSGHCDKRIVPFTEECELNSYYPEQDIINGEYDGNR